MQDVKQALMPLERTKRGCVFKGTEGVSSLVTTISRSRFGSLRLHRKSMGNDERGPGYK